jgi:hypothetical protein
MKAQFSWYKCLNSDENKQNVLHHKGKIGEAKRGEREGMPLIYFPN